MAAELEHLLDEDLSVRTPCPACGDFATSDMLSGAFVDTVCAHCNYLLDSRPHHTAVLEWPADTAHGAALQGLANAFQAAVQGKKKELFNENGTWCGDEAAEEVLRQAAAQAIAQQKLDNSLVYPYLGNPAPMLSPVPSLQAVQAPLTGAPADVDCEWKFSSVGVATFEVSALEMGTKFPHLERLRRASWKEIESGNRSGFTDEFGIAVPDNPSIAIMGVERGTSLKELHNEQKGLSSSAAPPTRKKLPSRREVPINMEETVEREETIQDVVERQMHELMVRKQVDSGVYEQLHGV